MRYFFRKLLQYKLRTLARLILWKFKPTVIGVTGTAGKTSTKEAIALVLSHSNKRVRSASGNLNTEFGFPLNILGDYGPVETELVGLEGPAGHTFEKGLFWARVLWRGLWNILTLPKTKYPEVLVLEYGADKPGDLDVLIDIARPTIAVVTAIGDIPVHVQAYRDIEGVTAEKQKLVEALPESGYAILNGDDPRVATMAAKTKARTLVYGFGEQASVRITELEFLVEGKQRVTPKPIGMTFKISHGGSFVLIRVERALGKPQAYACVAAASVGTILGMNLSQIADALLSYRVPGQRLRIVAGLENSVILDDSYNSSPVAVMAAFEVAHQLKAKRKIAVLGDMRELGAYEHEAHEQVGKLVKGIFDVLVTAGPAAAIIAEAARAAGMKEVSHFETPEEALLPVRDLIKAGDLVLIKASHSLHFEYIVDAVRLGRTVQ